MLDEYFLAHDEKDCLTSDKTLSSLSTPRMDQAVGHILYFHLCGAIANSYSHKMPTRGGWGEGGKVKLMDSLNLKTY
jgi:hypothetical protein